MGKKRKWGTGKVLRKWSERVSVIHKDEAGVLGPKVKRRESSGWRAIFPCHTLNFMISSDP
jgi:hypothetical protein